MCVVREGGITMQLLSSAATQGVDPAESGVLGGKAGSVLAAARAPCQIVARHRIGERPFKSIALAKSRRR